MRKRGLRPSFFIGNNSLEWKHLTTVDGSTLVTFPENAEEVDLKIYIKVIATHLKIHLTKPEFADGLTRDYSVGYAAITGDTVSLSGVYCAQAIITVANKSAKIKMVVINNAGKYVNATINSNLAVYYR
ncbi:MAG: hypothetical protein PUB24_06535 [Lachnospiraceae bacterium]|nr:hypothetical protein [Lachnospiraceae bacterium]